MAEWKTFFEIEKGLIQLKVLKLLYFEFFEEIDL